MKLTVFNGSPRGKKSNSTLLMTHFLHGFTSCGDHQYKIVYLSKTRQVADHVRDFREAENAILIFPLYTDAMPGIVKLFIEALEPLVGRSDNPSLGFIIQSGFPEANHSRFVARYMEKLAKRMNCGHTGTALRVGVEGIQIMPPWMTRKLYKLFFDLGAAYGRTGRFNPGIIRKLAPREGRSLMQKVFVKVGSLFGLDNYYWDSQLKSNNAFEGRFNRPFEDS